MAAGRGRQKNHRPTSSGRPVVSRFDADEQTWFTE
jgi:hypothetical protein